MLKKIKKVDKKYLWLIVAVLFSALVMLYFKDNFLGVVQTDLNKDTGVTEHIPLSDGEVRQYFNIVQDISYIDVLLINTGDETEYVTVSLHDAKTEQVIQEQVVGVEPQGTSEQQIHLDMQTSGMDPETKMYLMLKSDEENQDVYVCVNAKEFKQKFANAEYKQKFTQNGVRKEYRVRMAISYEIIKLIPFFMIAGICVLLAAVVFFVPIREGKHYNVQGMFLIIGITGGIAMAAMNPAANECDGWEHFLRATDVSYGNVLNPFVDLTHEEGVIRVPENIEQFRFTVVPANSSVGTLYTRDLLNQKFSSNSVLTAYDGGVTSISYWPQAIGIWIGRTLGLSMYACMLLARLCNLAVYIAIVYFAIKIIPIYKQLFTVIAVMPMMLYQAASCSPDALQNALCFLFSALCIRYALDEEMKLNWKNAIALSGILLVIFVIKYVYVCIGLLVFMIPMKRFGGKKEYWKSFGIAMIPLVIIGGYLVIHMFQSVSTLQATSEGMTQMQYLMQNPLALPKVIVATIVQHFDYYIRNINTLGWLKYPLNVLMSVMPCFIVGVACVDTNDISRKMSWVQKAICVATGVICIVGVFAALYIGDGVSNGIGSPVVNGVQGRYILPVIPLLFIGTGSKKIENKIERFSAKAVGCMGLMTAYAVIQLVGYCY